MNHILTCLSYLICALYSLTVFCINSDAIEKQAMISIDRLYHSQNLPSNASITERINWFSEQFKGRPYVLGSLGEGSKAIYDQFPRYRVDAFDCDTFVNTVLALALSNSFSSFEGCLHHLRYYQGQISYINRNHFMSLDWNQHNQALGILKDITSDIKDANNQPIALVAEALIDKPGWYSYKTIKTIRLQVPNTREQQNRLVALKNKAKHLPVTATKIPYLPLSVLFNKKGEANVDLFSHIPQSAIIQIVRPNWNLKEVIGTNLNVSHLGFAIWIKGILYFRQASSDKMQVVDIPLIAYLKAALKSPTIKGINIQIVSADKLTGERCCAF